MLEAEDQLFNDLFDHAPIGYVVLSPDGQIRRLNLAGAALLGEESGDLLGRWFGSFCVGAGYYGV